MVHFVRRDDLNRWLEDKPREWAVAIGVRTALRLVPTLALELSAFGIVGKPRREVVLPVFRGIAAAWAKSMWSIRRVELDAAMQGIKGLAGSSFGKPYGSAIRAIHDGVKAAASASDGDAIFATCNAVVRAAAATPMDDIWLAVSADATALESIQPMGVRPADLAIQVLWPIGTPQLAHDNWSKLKQALLDADQDWDVWTDWYEERLRGGAANEALELARVTIAEEIWLQGPKVLNAHIKELIAKHTTSMGDFTLDARIETSWDQAKRDEAKSPEEPEVPAVSQQRRPAIGPVPKQGPGPQFRANQEGLVDRAPPADVDADGNDIRTISQLRPLVLRCATDLQTRLSRNEFPELLDAAKNYQRALDPVDGEIEWGEVWGLGVLLQNAAISAERQIETRMLPALEDPAKTALDSLLTLHGPLVLATQDGAKLSESSAHFAMTRDQQQALRDAAQQVVERLNASPDVVTPRAVASLSAAADTIGQGPHPERGSIYGLATIKNISIALIGGAAVATPAVIGALLGALFDATLVGTIVGAPLSLVAVEAVKKNPAFIALVTQLGAKLETMTDIELGAWLEDKARRLAPLRSFVSNNRGPLRQIAATTPELKWMLKYIDFIVAETGVAGKAAKDATAGFVTG